MRVATLGVGGLLACFLGLGQPAVSAEAVPAPAFPLGVYLSWELPIGLADANQVTHREFLERLFRLCRERSCNTIWLTNMPTEHLGLALELAEANGMSVMALACDGKWDPYHEKDGEELRFRASEMVRAVQKNPTLATWILSDEPLPNDADKLNRFGQLLRELDPGRRTGTVLMPHTVKDLTDNLRVDDLAVDPYAFFAPGDPNGPHDPVSSRNHFRSIGDDFVARTLRAGMRPLMMPQSFVEVWGPYTYAEDGKLLGLKGSYHHYKMPTVAEMRWQLFESLRQGARGVIFFQLVPTMVWEEKTKTNPLPESVTWHEVLLRETVDADYGALATIHGNSTPQFDELGRLYKQLAPHGELFARWERLDEAAPVAADGVTARLFSDPATGARYLVAVNDDFDKETVVTIPAPEHSDSLTDLATGTAFPTVEGRVTIPLAPGAGAIVAL